MTAPTPLTPAAGRVRVHVIAPDSTTSRGYLAGEQAKGNHSKATDGSALTFTANALDPTLAAAPTMLEDAFVVPELDLGGVWTPFGTAYLLAPGSGTVIGDREGAAREHRLTAVGALQGLASECIVLPNEMDDSSPTMRYACGIDGNRYLGWQSKGYSESLHPGYWNDADIYTPASTLAGDGASAVTASDDTVTETAHGLTNGDEVVVLVTSGANGLDDGGTYFVVGATTNTFQLAHSAGGGAVSITADGVIDVYSGTGAKFNEPANWDANADAAEWVYRDAAEGGLTLIRIGTFTLTERTVVKFISAADEEHKVYLDGPNMGGVIIEGGGDETGYTEKSHWRRRLEAGTYRVGAEMTTVNSTGGDGNDSLRFACGTVDKKGRLATVLLKTDASTRVHRLNKADERPGMSPMETVRRLFRENSDAGVTGADILLDNKDFSDALDSDAVEPDPEDCREWVWPLGTSLASVLVDMSEDADFDLTTGFVFQCWLDRGADVSATVALVPGASPATAAMNILDYSWDSEPAGPTRFLTLSQDGYDVVIGATAEASTRPRFGFFESGASASIARAKRNARSAIRQNGNGARRYYSARIIAVTGAIPEDDFMVGDVIAARDYRNIATDLEVTDIGFEQGEGTTVFTIDATEA